MSEFLEEYGGVVALALVGLFCVSAILGSLVIIVNA